MPKTFRDLFEVQAPEAEIDLDDPSVSKVGYNKNTNLNSPFYSIHRSGLRTNFRDAASLASHLQNTHHVRNASNVMKELSKRLQARQ